ncbi:MAG TPA: hypothetical protein VGZ00_11965 [Candidatus Baltobacteraceae bacterium]|jgi:hypothetical protein|nr:hypothetical protein [Candidatus Baltobacteraceae bacterium]
MSNGSNEPTNDEDMTFRKFEEMLSSTTAEEYEEFLSELRSQIPPPTRGWGDPPPKNPTDDKRSQEKGVTPRI